MFDELDPSPRLLMGPGPVDVYPRVLRAMSTPMLGQFDPEFTDYMGEVMALYRALYRTDNHWTFLIDGTARAGIEACMTSIIAEGDKVLVPIFGRFGHLLTEIARRSRAEVITLETEWGQVFDPQAIEDAVKKHQPKMIACVHGDTSVTMAQPLADIGRIARAHDALLYVDATCTVGGMELAVDDWQIDAISGGLQKCMSGPPGCSPISINERVEAVVAGRKHIEGGIRPEGYAAANGPVIQSNYFDLGMLMDYWSPKRLNHHTEATSMLYAARECARVVLQEGLDNCIARHHQASGALRAGLQAMGLELFGDPNNWMTGVTGIYIPQSVKDHPGSKEGEAVRHSMLHDFGIEIGTSFGPLVGKIWRIGTMGHVCRKPNILRCLTALEVVLRHNGYAAPAGAGVDAAMAHYNSK